MLSLAQINIGTNFGSITGVIYVLLAFAYLLILLSQNRLQRWAQIFFIGEIAFIVIAIANIGKIASNTEIIIALFFILNALPIIFAVLAQFGFSNSNNNIFVQIFESVVIPNMLFFGGAILVFQGWRLDPILQTQAAWMLIAIVYLVFKSLRTTRNN